MKLGFVETTLDGARVAFGCRVGGAVADVREVGKTGRAGL